MGGGWWGSKNSVWAGRMGTRGLGGRPQTRWDEGVDAAKFILSSVKAPPLLSSPPQPCSSFLNRKFRSIFSNEATNSSVSSRCVQASNNFPCETSVAGSRIMFDVLPDCLDNDELIKLINEKPKLSVFSICTVFDKLSRHCKDKRELDPG